MAGDQVAIDAAPLFGEPFDEAGAIDDFAGRFGQRLALFEREDAAEIVLVLDHQVKPAAKHTSAILGSASSPALLRQTRRFDRRLRLLASKLRHASDEFARRRVGYIDRIGGIRFDPFATNQGSLAKQ
ncbi:hypothetical protein BLJAPNOD_00618 [Ensifer sp. M14]|nr:hypothetical protein BLJAPNOD_00618 [Ensifer sp. M14]